MLKNIDKTNFFNPKTVPIDWGLVLEYFFVTGTHTDSFNSLMEALT